MVIAVDGNEANVEKKVGVSVYTYELLRHFRSASSKELQFIIFLRQKPRFDLPKQSTFFKYHVVKGPFLWRNLFLPLALRKHGKLDVFFSPAHYTPPTCPAPVVVTIHDLAYIRYPEEFLKRDLYKLSRWTKEGVLQAKKVIAVSQSTKNDLVYYFGTDEKKISVVHNGFSSKESRLHGESNVLEDLGDKKDQYILFAGTIQPRKNIQTLLHAFRLVLEERPQMKLVIVGKKGWLYDKIFQIADELNLKNKAIFTDYIPNADMAVLYNNTAVFVLPSLYEGFGLPVLEAMSHHAPVVASERSSLPEICGNACLFFNPHSAVELKEQIMQVITSPKVRERLIREGQIQVKKFSWEKCAKETLTLLTAVAKHKS